MARRHRHAVPFVLVTILLDTIGLGLVIPVLPGLLLELSGPGATLGDAATWGGWLAFAYAATQFVFAPVLGNISDAFGRRPVLLASLFAFAIDYAIMGIAGSLWLLFVGRLLTGVAGGSYVAANACMADISTPEQRAQRFGLIGAAFGVGFIFGPVVGGLLGEYGPRVPFFAAAIVAFANLVYGALCVPETLAREHRRPFTLRRANPVGAVLQMRRHPLVFGLLGCVLCYQFAHDANPSAFSYFTMTRLDFTPRDIGIAMGVLGVCMAAVQGGLVGVLVPRLGERRAAQFGLVAMATGFAGYAFASAPWMLYAAMPIVALGGVTMPALRSVMSRAVPADAQGELQGAIASLNSITIVVAPLVMTRLFAAFTQHDGGLWFPGAPFLAASALLLLALAALSWVLRR